jgi:hypothetical protein
MWEMKFTSPGARLERGRNPATEERELLTIEAWHWRGGPTLTPAVTAKFYRESKTNFGGVDGLLGRC